MSSDLKWATFCPDKTNGKNPCQLYNFLNGAWVKPNASIDIVDPLNGEAFIKMPNTTFEEAKPFIEKMNSVPKSGLHNPLKNPERCTMYGEITFKLAMALQDEKVADYFARIIQRAMPKSYAQAMAEVRVSRTFLKNFTGDQVRFLARGFHVSGDHTGQQSQGYRWPFGAVSIVAPFNFPFEIPVLQLMGALYMGNHVTLKCASTTSMVMEEWIRLMIECGMPKGDVNLIHCSGSTFGRILKESKVRSVQFTGSSSVAEQLCVDLHGKIRVEDAGFDWKIMGPDVDDIEYVSWQCDQDAHALSGQKCSATSMLFVHENWMKTDLLKNMESYAAARKIDDLSVGPVMSHTTEEMIAHANKLAAMDGGKIMWGAKELPKHTIPKKYGAIHPTAVFVPLKEILKPENFDTCCTEIFAPFQVITSYKDDELHLVLEACERMEQHLTAAIVSNDVVFQTKCLGATVNGTTYVGRRARTTGAPQNHWFGPCGDPRAAGIGTIEAIRLVWSGHREIIHDLIVPEKWTRPQPN